ncbi:TOMM precursor leader peptide-binding protein [Kitasatospora sp. NPDC058397]|uniref:TOMM precursor leader peptide-binding protein n=1 Tax=unclassified Kitasatospora TaxID=2633591 RepID=UPI003656DE50
MEKHLLVLAAGPFGKDVADRLKRRYRVTRQEVDSGTHPSLWPHADLIVLATSHERPRIAEALDRAAFAWRIPWIAVHAGATEVQCGPVVVPGRTACHQCFVRRREQHKRPEHPTSGSGDRHPSGYPVHHVGVAAAFACQAVDEVFGASEAAGIGGTVRRFDQVSGMTSKATVVAVDRCPRCRARVAGDELWRELAPIEEGQSL